MTTKLFFTAEAIVCILFGIGLTFTPSKLAAEYFTDVSWLNSGVTVVATGYGTLLLACALAYWKVRNGGPSDGRTALIWLATMSNVFLVIMHSKFIVGGIETSLTWGTVAMCAFFAGWGAMLLIKAETA